MHQRRQLALSVPRWPTIKIEQLALIVGVFILAFEPIRWLVASWFDPVWNSNGWLLAVAVAVLLLRSLSSPRIVAPTNVRAAWTLLIASAAIRLASQVLGVSFIGAITLACDVYAVALIFGTHQRARAVSPAGLAILFFLSLPLERVLQRILGFGLQQVSAKGACGLLEALGFEPVCTGVSILIGGHNVLVDVPCSGARGLLLVLALFIIIATIQRLRIRDVTVGLVITLAAAWAGNALRITLLAIGIVKQREHPGFNIMEAPWHEMVGVATLGLSLLVVLIWAGCSENEPNRPQVGNKASAALGVRAETTMKHRLPLAIAFVAMALVIVNLPQRPIDVSAPTSTIRLPMLLADRERERLPLLAVETRYFTQYGGEAERARYGSHIILLATTTSPLRHLHAPDECLRALGHQVRYLGLVDGALPAGLYRSKDDDGQSWRVAVSFVSDRGEVVTSVAHAVWLWLKRPHSTWTMVQRIRAWNGDPSVDEIFDRGVTRVLDLPATESKRAATAVAHAFDKQIKL